MFKWNLYCSNFDCGTFLEQQATEPDVTCPRCGGSLQVSEKVIFKETKENDDLCSD
jgi:DNA-directed RNA polymerase subunit RPC12/RpoP